MNALQRVGETRLSNLTLECPHMRARSAGACCVPAFRWEVGKLQKSKRDDNTFTEDHDPLRGFRWVPR